MKKPLFVLISVFVTDMASGSELIPKTPPPPPPPPPSCLFEAGFESGMDGFTSCSDGCNTGSFVVGTPDPTTWQVGGAAGGSNALFTQPNSGGVGTDDVDGGACEALSPAIDARAEAAVEVSLDYFHGQRDAGDDSGDGFLIELLNDGEVAETLVSIGDATHPPAWTSVSARVDHPGKIQLRVRTTDGTSDGDIVEGGIDNVSICPATPTSPPPPPPGSVVDEGFEAGASGWTNDGSSTCTTGAFVVGNPTQVVNGGVILQVGGSHSGTGSIFTAVNVSAGVDDVDGGNCVLTSPTWNVSCDSTLSVWYWHGQRDAGDDGGDFFLLEYSTDGGTSWSTLASNGDMTSNAAWNEATAQIPNASSVKLRLQCSDGAGPGDLIECGLDDISIVSNTPDCLCFQPSEADTRWRHVACKSNPEGPCEDIGRWKGQHLFGDFEDTHLPDPSLPEELKPFCVYTLPVGATVTPEDELQLSALACHHPTRMALTGAGASSELEMAIWKTLRDQFLAKSGPALLQDTTAPVRLALLDTLPTADPLTDEPRESVATFRSEHGSTLRELAKALLYGGAGAPPCGLAVTGVACPVEVSSQLTLPFFVFDRETNTGADTESGGFLGTICDLASAVWKEYKAWKSANEALMEDRRLVLNLSLAWQRAFGGLEANENEMPLDVRAIYRVLRYVVSDGALVIAAAGNEPDEFGEPDLGPFFPGAWENRPAPIASCGSRYQPLVYAAAGVRRDGRLLVNAQPASSPPLVAFSDHAVVGLPGETPQEKVPSAILTGSSVASLVTSAAAAAVWHDAPELTAAQVMDRVYETGEELTYPADFCLGSPVGEYGACAHEARPTVHRVSVCRAFNDCRDSACSCIEPPGPWDLDLDQVQLPRIWPQEAGSSPSQVYSGLAARPWASSQPGSDLCPSCVVKEGTLYGVIDDSFDVALDDVTLEVCDENSSLPGTMTAGSSFEAVLSGLEQCPELDLELSASFTTEEGETLSVSSPVYVDDQ